jgi:hypothetical protein
MKKSTFSALMVVAAVIAIAALMSSCDTNHVSRHEAITELHLSGDDLLIEDDIFRYFDCDDFLTAEEAANLGTLTRFYNVMYISYTEWEMAKEIHTATWPENAVVQYY